MYRTHSICVEQQLFISGLNQAPTNMWKSECEHAAVTGGHCGNEAVCEISSFPDIPQSAVSAKWKCLDTIIQ